MESILKRSLIEKTALDMIYMRNDGLITKRSIIVRQINQSYIRAFCFNSRQTAVSSLHIFNIIPLWTPSNRIIF
ncbi:hypothetical protein ACUUYQ_04775 [Bacillus halotolerans]|uniref:hypothetical protein n=2 Tax=Bacillus halotolerans TaxID=260554 RepID=UPI0007519176|nr:hypothetical protein [Bacillus halotolerans]AZV48186.1 hypothetical protein DIC78_03550 [Bacillus halotolerans]KUP31046.1 hypothetical protein AU387_15365 [Bacillus halotolerans]MCP9299243.1 hypothetical protein [Bacillus halotolerans]QDK68579.1 hypothetical protein FLQ13_14600 [Bacillus halotolerans]WOC58111.1 hypothetical protein RYX39_06675 [Bacillus halotolerans]